MTGVFDEQCPYDNVPPTPEEVIEDVSTVKPEYATIENMRLVDRDGRHVRMTAADLRELVTVAAYGGRGRA